MSTFRHGKTSKLTHLLSFIATSVVVFGVLALYYPHILNNWLPQNLLQVLSHNQWLPETIFIGGLLLNVVAFVVNVLSKDETMMEFAK